MTKILKPGHCYFKKGEVGHTKSGLLYIIVSPTTEGNLQVDVREEQGFTMFNNLSYTHPFNFERRRDPLWHSWFYDNEGKFLVPSIISREQALLISQHFDLL